jgi:hypothetical protein
MYVLGKLSTQNNAELLLLNSVRLALVFCETRYLTLEQDPDGVT